MRSLLIAWSAVCCGCVAAPSADHVFTIGISSQVACDTNNLNGKVEPGLLSHLAAFCSLDKSTPELEIVRTLDSLKRYPGSAEAGRIITARLRENDRLFDGRGTEEINRIRAYMIATLGQMKAPDALIPYLATELKTSQHNNRRMLAAAARGARGIVDHQQVLVPFLCLYLNPNEKDETVDIDNYNTWPPRSATTIKTEVLKTIGSYGSRAAEALPDLHKALLSSTDPQLNGLIKEAIHAINFSEDIIVCEETGRAAKRLSTRLVVQEPWLAPSQRRSSPFLQTTFTDHFGQQSFFERLRGKPFAITLFYTRCDNLNKCSATVSNLLILDEELRKSGLSGNYNLLAISLDPQYDSPLIMNSYATSRGANNETSVRLLRIDDINKHESLIKHLGIAAAYRNNLVSSHGVEILLFDKHGAYVKRFHTGQWDKTAVVDDMKRLAAE